MWTIIDDKEKPASPLPEIDEAIQLEAQKQPGLSLGKKAIYSLTIIALGLLLLLQIYIHFTQTVISIPLIRQPMVWACDKLDCSVPLRQQPDAWGVSTSSMTLHPDFKDTWRLNAELQHQGKQALSLPAMLITFYDRNGDPVAARSFAPGEYLSNTDSLTRARATSQERQPGSVIAITLDIIDPGAGLPNFDIALTALSSGELP